MADIDFITDIRQGFSVSLGDNPKSVTGNRALLNRFEITLLTRKREFGLGESIIIDNYGGDADRLINKPRVLSDVRSISAAVKLAMDQTVKSMQEDEPEGLPETEKLAGAEIIEMLTVADVITASISVLPVEVDSSEELKFNLPIIKGL
jgi:hypothetical protein